MKNHGRSHDVVEDMSTEGSVSEHAGKAGSIGGEPKADRSPPACFEPANEKERALQEAAINAAIAHGMSPDEARRAVAEALHAGRAVANEPTPEASASESAALPPVPLRAAAEPARFPIEALPRWVREWVQAEAHATQTPVDLGGMLTLAVLGTCCAPKIDLHVRGRWYESTNLYVCIALRPACRKSAVFADATAPLSVYQREVSEAQQPAIARASALLRSAKQRQESAEASAAKSSDRMAAEIGIDEATREVLAAEAAVPVERRLFSGDVTQEKLVVMLAEQDGCMAILDAEGYGPISAMMGKYNNSQMSPVEVFLKAHAGDSIWVDRLNRERVSIARPRLTIGITIQPSLLERFARERQFRGIGLLARFLWSVPADLLGSRVARPTSVPESIHEAYARNLRVLLDLESGPNGAPHIVRFSRDADDLLAGFQEHLEPELGVGGRYAHLADWVGKLPGAVVRIAGLLHAADAMQEALTTEVSAATMARAIQIGEYLLSHAQVALADICVDPRVLDAEHVLAWLKTNRILKITKRDLFCVHKARFPKVSDLEPALELLRKHRWIRLLELPPDERRSGRPASPTYGVHPSLFSNESPSS